GSPSCLSHVAFYDPSHVGTSNAANVHSSHHADLQKGVVAVSVVGKAPAEFIRR
nr:hypothetical protein [Tanacetum cinerariifolium]GFC98012.1 hypothetical protein [Tanacetum cinerariifolium]